MNIETKFNVDDLVKHKYQRSAPNKIFALEIKEVHSQSCYGGSQVFYLTRVIHAHKPSLSLLDEVRNKETDWTVEPGISKHEQQLGWDKFREDELVFLTAEEIGIIKGTLPPKDAMTLANGHPVNQKAYEEGKRAKEKGLSTNPYTQNSDEFYSWNKGWNDAP